MDSMIPIGQKNTLVEYMILSDADNRPPMLEKDLDLHTTNFDQLNAYLEQHELHANEVCIMRELNQDPLALVANHQMTPSHFNTFQSSFNQQTHLAEFPQIDSGLAVLVFKQGNDPIDAINKMMSFLSTVDTSRFLSTNNQLRNSSNPRQQATIHDGRVTVQPLQGRQNSYVIGTSRTRANILGTRGTNSVQQRVVKCFNCQGKVTWQDSAQSQRGKGVRHNPRVAEGPVTQMVITHNVAYQADDLDAYDSDCDDISTAKAVLMANLSSYGSDVLSKVPHSENTHNDMLNQSVQEMTHSEQTYLVNYLKNEITSNNNIIPYSQYLLETQHVAAQYINSSAQQDAMILSVLKQLSNQFVDFEKELLTETFNVLKNESKEKEIKNIDKEIALEKKKAHQIRPMLYDGSVIAKETNVISIVDSEETLMLEEESRSKIFKSKIKLSDEQAFWLQISHPNTDQYASSPVKIKAPRELPKVSLVNTSLKKLKYHLGQFDNVVKKHITPDALTKGEWGSEHTKAVFLNEIIPFLKILKDIFNVFDKDLLNEVTKVQTAFNQKEDAVQQYFVDKQCFEIQKKQFLIENDRLLEQIIS
ncbi:hypothetical protein Tco_1173333 [Tanacetum coccineum]